MGIRWSALALGLALFSANASAENHVVVAGQQSSGDIFDPSTTVYLAYAPIDDLLASSARWKVHTVWSGRAYQVNAIAAPSDDELYLFGGQNGGILSATPRALWRFHTNALPL